VLRRYRGGVFRDKGIGTRKQLANSDEMMWPLRRESLVVSGASAGGLER
jgi:hypothetical protein